MIRTIGNKSDNIYNMTERREQRGEVFTREVRRRAEAANIDLEGRGFDVVVNAAMDLTALSNGEAEPNETNREQFFKRYEEKVAQAVAA